MLDDLSVTTVKTFWQVSLGLSLKLLWNLEHLLHASMMVPQSACMCCAFFMHILSQGSKYDQVHE